jgi:hypothetical protein
MPAERDPVVHLYRGAPSVRDWSKYQETVHDWTLCGIDRSIPTTNVATEVAGSVTCPHCLELMKPAPNDRKTRKSDSGVVRRPGLRCALRRSQQPAPAAD